MRVVGGRLSGRRLLAFKGSRVRPTSDKVKGAIFNMLGQGLDGERVLDLFAGTGALGIEAVSRGAAEVVFVDRDTTLIEKNLQALDIKTGIDTHSSLTIMEKDVLAALKGLGVRSGKDGFDIVFDIVFIDAPYKDAALLKDVLTELSASKVLKDDGLIVCELSKKEAAELSSDAIASLGMKVEREKFYGDTAVVILSRYSK